MRNYQIYFIRHGMTENSLKGILSAGGSESRLATKGKESLLNMKTEFEYPKVDKVYVSPTMSCLETVDILYPDSFVQEAAGLKDINLGAFEGKTIETLSKDKAYVNWVKNSLENHPPGGETTEDFSKRVQLTFEEIAQAIIREKIYRVAVVTHSSVLMQLLFSFGLPKRAPHQWQIGFGKGVSALLNLQMWSNDKLFEIAGIVPYGAKELE